MKQTLIIAAALVTCSILGACGSGSDRGVEVRTPAPESERIPTPDADVSFSNK